MGEHMNIAAYVWSISVSDERGSQGLARLCLSPINGPVLEGYVSVEVLP